MLNKYFHATRDNLDFVFLNAVLKNIYFALISLDYIFNHSDFNYGIYHDKHTFYFFHIQSILTACGNISNVFYNNSHFDLKKQNETTKRCQRLRTLLNISKERYPLIFQKEVRNTNEHFDERYDEVGEIGDYNLLDNDTDTFIRDVIMTNKHLRTYDIMSFVYYTYGRNMEKISYDFKKLRDELTNLRDCINDNPTLSSAWEE